jgi:hypothetical protein
LGSLLAFLLPWDTKVRLPCLGSTTCVAVVARHAEVGVGWARSVEK